MVLLCCHVTVMMFDFPQSVTHTQIMGGYCLSWTLDTRNLWALIFLILSEFFLGLVQSESFTPELWGGVRVGVRRMACPFGPL